MQQLSAPKISHLPYHGSFLPLDNRSKNNVWSCNFPGTFILQEPQTQIYHMDFLKLRIKDCGLLVAANSNVLYQFQWSTVSPLNVPSFLLVRACYSSTLTVSANAGCTLYRMHRLFLVTCSDLFPAQWLEWQFPIFSDGIKFPAQVETAFLRQAEETFFLVQ